MRKSRYNRMTVEDILESIERICRSNDVKGLLLFGSYAKKTFTPTSDIDIAVKGCRNLRTLREEIDRIPTLKKIDVVDYDNLRNDLLREDIDRHGKQIY